MTKNHGDTTNLLVQFEHGCVASSKDLQHRGDILHILADGPCYQKFLGFPSGHRLLAIVAHYTCTTKTTNISGKNNTLTLYACKKLNLYEIYYYLKSQSLYEVQSFPQ